MAKKRVKVKKKGKILLVLILLGILAFVVFDFSNFSVFNSCEV